MKQSSGGPRSVVDSNIFVSATISPVGLPRKLLTAWFEQRFRLLLSDRQRAELMDVFARPSLARRFRVLPQDLERLVLDLDAAERVDLLPVLPVSVRDPKDEHILAAALAGESDYLVTGDQDLLVLAGDPRLGSLQIVTGAAFHAILGAVEHENENA